MKNKQDSINYTVLYPFKSNFNLDLIYCSSISGFENKKKDKIKPTLIYISKNMDISISNNIKCHNFRIIKMHINNTFGSTC